MGESRKSAGKSCAVRDLPLEGKAGVRRGAPQPGPKLVFLGVKGVLIRASRVIGIELFLFIEV